MNHHESPQTQQLAMLEAKIDEMHNTLKQLRLYFLIMVGISVGAVVLPLVGLVFAIPILLDSLSAITDSGLL